MIVTLWSYSLSGYYKNGMATRQEVEQFLAQFKMKLEVFGVFFLDGREKNA